MSDLRTVLAATLLLGLAACGTEEPEPTDPPETTMTTSTPSPRPSESASPERLTGRIGIAPEERCTVLTTSGTPGAWVLIGAVSSLRDGDRVTVVGRADPDATTRCQQGPVFVVAEVDPTS